MAVAFDSLTTLPQGDGLFICMGATGTLTAVASNDADIGNRQIVALRQ